MANKKTTDHAAEVLKTIMAEVNKDVIKDYQIPTLCNVDTAKVTGFAVILTLSAKYTYTCDVLKDWQDRLVADDYQITVRHNQLRVRFNVMYHPKKQKRLVDIEEIWNKAADHPDSRHPYPVINPDTQEMAYAYYDKHLRQWKFDRDYDPGNNMMWLDIEKILPTKEE